MKKLFILALLLTPFASAKTLTKITLLPPSDGYHINPAGGSIQLVPLCTYDDATTDNCSTQSLTWGSSDPVDLTVNSSTGLATMGPGQGGAITSIVRSSNEVTVTTTSAPGGLTIYSQVVVEGVTNSSFDGWWQLDNYPSGNTIKYPQTAANATSSGGAVYRLSNPDVYAYAGTILGHHPINVDFFVPTSLEARPSVGADENGTEVVVGTTALVGALATDGTNNIGVGDYCAYTTSDPTIATVNNIGEVTGVSVGTANITCTFDGQSVARPVSVISPTLSLNTIYVRPDGGTLWDAAVPTGQCTGLTDAPYPGTGTGQACGVSNPMYCFTDETSTTVYTGRMHGTDTCMIEGTAPYNMQGKGPGSPWVYAGHIPSGTPAHPTRILGSNYASCSTDPNHPGNRAQLVMYYSADNVLWDFNSSQNIDMECIDMRNFQDCNSRLGPVDFPCQDDAATFNIFGDDITANITLKNDNMHGFLTGLTGTFGPGVVFDHVSSQMHYLDGINFDTAFGEQGDRTDGFTATALNSSYNGCTNEVDKTLSSVSRDGAGNLTATFTAGQIVNYVSGTNLYLQGMTPSDLNGTFPVTSATFNQNSATITGGSCVVDGSSYGNGYTCTFTTSAAPTFSMGAFVNISGASPSWLNAGYEVYSTSGTGFVVKASSVTRPGWTTATISSGGTASTAITVVASAAGGAESASTVGTATHVIPAHRCIDQAWGGNGDGVGTGSNTIGSWASYSGAYIGNLQDGWDMLHSAMVSSLFIGNKADGNEGAPAKFGNADTGAFDANVMIGNANSLLAFNANYPPDYNQYVGLNSRAGDAFPIGSRMWSRISISNNTWETSFPTIMDDSCADDAGCTALPSIANFVIQNNLYLGFLDSNNPSYSGQVPGVYYANGSTVAPWVWSNNIGFNVRNEPAGTNNKWDTNPLVVAKIPDISSFAGETAALVFDMNLTAPSPAIGTGVENSYVPAKDSVGYPYANPPSMGGLEFQTDPSTAAYFGGSVIISGSAVIR